MSVIQEHTIKRLRDFRAGLLAIPSDELSYGSMEKHLVDNRGAVDAVYAYNQIIRLLSPYQTVTDLAVLEAVRQEAAKIVDDHIVAADAQQIVRPVLDELILKVKDSKLATLLNEFNAAKELQPNLAAIGFRTIVCIVIQQRAQITDPNSPLAKRTDFALKPMLDDAIAGKIFGDGLTKLLDGFRSRGLKERSDNVAHKPGADMLVSKMDLSAAVDLLNNLLPSIQPPTPDQPQQS